MYKSYKGIQSHELHAIREIFNVGSDFYKELIEIGLIKKIPTQGKQFVITKNSDNWPTIEEIRQCHQNQTDRVNKSKSKTEITENQLAKKEYAKEEVFMIIERIFEEKFNININELINFIQSTKPWTTPHNPATRSTPSGDTAPCVLTFNRMACDEQDF